MDGDRPMTRSSLIDMAVREAMDVIGVDHVIYSWPRLLASHPIDREEDHD